MGMRVLVVHHGDFPRKSANRLQVIRTCEGLIEAGADVTLCAVGKDPADIRKFYSVEKSLKFRLLHHGPFHLFRSLRLACAAAKMHIPFVLTRDLIIAGILPLLAPHTRVIYELHDADKPVWWWLLFRLAAAWLHGVVVISDGLKKAVCAREVHVQVIVARDGVDLRRFTKKVSRVMARNNVGFPVNERIVMYLGGFAAWKGTDTILAAAQRMRSVRFVLVGDVSEEVRAHAASNVLFVPYVNPVHAPFYLRSADVLVLPTSGKYAIGREYTSPLKLFEYLASGIPVVASDVPSTREVVDEKSVSFFRPDDVKSLQSVLERVLADPEAARARARIGERLVRAYSWQKRGTRILRFFGRT